MSLYMDRLAEARNREWNRAREIMDRAQKEARDLTAGEKYALDQIDKGLDETSAELKVVAKMEKTARAAGVSFTSYGSGTNAGEMAQLKQLLRSANDGQSGAMETSLSAEAIDARSLSTISGGGGVFVPTTIADQVFIYERTLNPIMGISTVLSTTSGAPIVLPRVTSDVTAGGSITNEGGTITEGDPTVSQVTLGAFKVAHITLWSNELDQDDVVGIDKLVTRTITRPIGLGWGEFFTNGTGTTQPLGYMQSATNGGTALGTASGNASDTFFSASDLVDLLYGLPSEARLNASWVVSTSALAKMRKFKDANGQFLWDSGSPTTGEPDRFLGRPVYENPAMAAVASATKSVAVGDFSQYVVRDVTPMRIEISDQYKWNSDQLAIRVVTRRDAALANPTSIRYLVSANV